MKTLIAFTAAVALAGGTTAAAPAPGGAAEQAAIAHAHALMAQNAKTVAEAHAHLHHVINCLVGPKGAGFDTAAGDPCKDHGNGAIPDAAADKPLQGRLRAALADAEAGLKAESLHAIGKDAGKAATGLQAAPAGSAAPSSW